MTADIMKREARTYDMGGQPRMSRVCFRVYLRIQPWYTRLPAANSGVQKTVWSSGRMPPTTQGSDAGEDLEATFPRILLWLAVWASIGQAPMEPRH